MITPIDGWTLAHGLFGFLSGSIKLRRLWLYPVPIVWEVYQLFFHYQPHGESFKCVWLNSVCDIVVFPILYETARWQNLNFGNIRLFHKLSNEGKAILAYILLTLIITWLFWDDIFRLHLAARMPSSQLPLLFGALSPCIALFITRTWFKYGSAGDIALSWITREKLFYYTALGMLPSVIIYLAAICVTIFWHIPIF